MAECLKWTKIQRKNAFSVLTALTTKRNLLNAAAMSEEQKFYLSFYKVMHVKMIIIWHITSKYVIEQKNNLGIAIRMKVNNESALQISYGTTI